MNRLLLLLLLLGLSLAPVLCRAAEPQADEAKAIAAIEELGGKVTFDKDSPDKPKPWIGVDLDNTKVTDAELGYLKEFPQLQRLDLMKTKVTDAGLVHLRALTQLRSVNLLGTQVTDTGLVYLKGLPQLESLNLQRTQITGTGLIHVEGLTQLRFLEPEANQGHRRWARSPQAADSTRNAAPGSN